MGEAAQKESSMEDILASIRKIITSDDPKKTPDTASAKPEPSAIPEPQAVVAIENSAANAPEIKNEIKNEIKPEPKPIIPSASTSTPASVPAGSLAALSAQMKSQTPSAPTKPTQSASPSTAQMSATPASQTSKAVSASKTEPATSLADLAAKVQGDISGAPIPSTPSAPTPRSPIKRDADSPFSGESLRELASRVASSPSQKPDADLTDKPEKDGPETDTAPAAQAQSPRQTADTETDKSEQVAFKEALVAPSTSAAVTSSMDRLREASQNVEAAQVEAVLRPMLKEWLDDNLPSLVEKLVQEEISRISNKS